MTALNVIYRKKNFRIYGTGSKDDMYIVHNTDMPFEEYHTHIKNFNTCKYIINMCLSKTVPYHLSDYLLVSLIRLSTDKKYINDINKLLEQNKRKRGRKREKEEFIRGGFKTP